MARRKASRTRGKTRPGIAGYTSLEEAEEFQGNPAEYNEVRDTVQCTGESLLNPVMSIESISPLPVSAEANRSRIMTRDFISVGEALKLVPYFKGNKQEVHAFTGNVDTAFAVINLTQEDVLYKFVLTRISGEPRTVISHRNLDSWVELKEFLKNLYIEKRTLDFHASQLFAAKQKKDEKVAEWIQRIQLLGSQFREAALLNCSEGAREGILDLSDRLQNICFVQGLGSERIQTIVRSRNYRNFDEIAETALVEESAITSRQDRYKIEGGMPLKCGNCGKTGLLSSKCFARERKEARVNLIIANSAGTSSLTCFRCGEKGHIARHCRKPPKKGLVGEKGGCRETSWDVRRAAARPSPPLSRLWTPRTVCYFRLCIDVGKEMLLLLVDSRVDISLIKSERLVGTTKFEPEERVRMKSVDGSIIETHGSIRANTVEGALQIPFSFQLVSKQVELVGDGILGWDFLQQMQAQMLPY